MRQILSTLMILLFGANVAHAQVLSELVTVSGDPVAQWIVVFDSNKVLVLPAAASQDADRVTVSADLPPLSDRAYLNAVVQTSSGELFSSNLHPLGETNSFMDSRGATQRKLANLISALRLENEEASRLKAQSEALSHELRDKAGLSQVDQIYRRIEQINLELESLRP